MTIEEAIEILESHNRWRRGDEIPMERPDKIGMAIDLVIIELKELRNKNIDKHESIQR